MQTTNSRGNADRGCSRSKRRKEEAKSTTVRSGIKRNAELFVRQQTEARREGSVWFSGCSPGKELGPTERTVVTSSSSISLRRPMGEVFLLKLLPTSAHSASLRHRPCSPIRTEYLADDTRPARLESFASNLSENLTALLTLSSPTREIPTDRTSELHL